MNESYNNIGKTKIGSIYLSALRSVLDVFEEAGSLLYSGQEIAVFKDYFLPAFHGGRKFNVRIAKILWLFCRYKAFTMKHDILVEHRDLGLFILDTKYKHLSRFEGNEDVKKSVTDEVSQSDLYQVIEYAAHRDIDSAYLLYPMYRLESEEPTDVVLERKSVEGKKISVHVVRLPFIFEDDTEATKEHLARSIKRIFNYYKALSN